MGKHARKATRERNGIQARKKSPTRRTADERLDQSNRAPVRSDYWSSVMLAMTEWPTTLRFILIIVVTGMMLVLILRAAAGSAMTAAIMGFLS